MAFYARRESGPHHFRLVTKSFLQHSGLPFADVLDAETIQQAFDDEGASFGEEEDAVFTPALTLWAFLSQVLHKGEQRSCVAAVARTSCAVSRPRWSARRSGPACWPTT